ncbi:winged helix-turn-helix transcriptional regulator [Kineosporiaceae bacterium B12]|nr:winged helix-turn-helix transcriptional regulator [Kineococcus rubinsiae]
MLRGLVDTPPHDLAAADALLLRIGRLQAVAEPLLGSIESATGLRRLAIFVLQAVAAGHRHPRAIGRQVGADTASVQSTLDQLCDDGYVQPAPPRPGDRHVELTDAGRAVLEHIEAMTLRSTDAVLQLIGPERAREVTRALEVLVDALTVPLSAEGVALPGAPVTLPAVGPRAIGS